MANGGTEQILVVTKSRLDEGDEDAAPKEPTLFLDEVVLLTDTIRAEARAMTLRVSSAKHAPEMMPQLAAVLAASPGGCSVQLAVELEGGAEAILAAPRLRIEPCDALFSGVERLLGARAIELR